MAKLKPRTLFRVLLLVAVVGAVAANFLVGSDGLPFGLGKLDYDSASKKLARVLKEVDSSEQFVRRRASVTLGEKSDLNRTLPDIGQFPLVVNPRGASTSVVVELFVSTEKSGDGTDGWLVEVARAFNQSGQRLSDGRMAKVRVRKIASGTGYQFIASGKYRPQGFSPSNHLWVRMAEAYGVPTEPVRERLVGNVAGVVMKSEIAERLRSAYGELDVEGIIDSVVQGTMVMGYTNPFASSTGLNFLVSVLARFSGGNEARMLSPDVVSAFESFQRGVPFVALTTLQMRESVENDGSLDAFVMEYQTFAQARALQSGYEFVPFGIRHDNPLYAIGDLGAQEREALEAFASFSEGSRWRSLARQYGFDADVEHEPAFDIPSGDSLVRAQQVWKEKKDAGRPIAAVFLCDVSGSMAGARVRGVRQALTLGADFITPSNAIGMVLFDQKVRIVLPIKPFDLNHKAAFLGAVQGMAPGGSTAMYDGIAVALSMLVEARRANPEVKPVLFVLTDGATNVGHDFADVRRIIEGLGIPIYTIGYEAQIDELRRLSATVEAASLNADVERIDFMIGSLLNAQM
jgi:Ca-activated chloride channel family protein